MTGKSTVATEIASMLKRPCISTDDIGEVLQTVTPINPMQGADFRAYYESTPIEKLITDIKKYHKYMEPAINRLLEIHASWGTPLIMEGWALYPSHIQPCVGNNIAAVWLIASDELLESRLLNKSDFLSGTAAKNYLLRSKWHNNLLLEQCRATNAHFISVRGDESVNSIAEKILSSSS